MINRLYCPRGRQTVLRVLKRLWVFALVLALLAGAGALLLWQRPLPLRLQGEPVVDVLIPLGASARTVAKILHTSGVDLPEVLLFGGLRLSGQSQRIQAGAYELPPGTNFAELVDKLVRGEQAVRRVTLVEGWNIRQVLQALKAAPHLQDDVPAWAGDPAAWMQGVGLRGTHPEGRFFPDTYVYPKRSKASEVLRQAAAAMDAQLAKAWEQRMPGSALRSADEALILASIIEKETGQAADREQIAAVFHNRLKIGMRLQTDPTVIYGLGAAFDGNLRRRDLEADTPYNTYRRAGLPPTPIAMPGAASLLAAVQPASSKALYFVAKGDGSSQFSATLAEHNQAVRRYQLQR